MIKHIDRLISVIDKKQLLYCVDFYTFKSIAYTNEWDEKVPDNVAIISITDVIKTRHYHICKDAINVLNLDFDDADPMGYGLDDNTKVYNNDLNIIYFFTKEMADKAVKFIETNKDKHFVIHCGAGVSRSQAFIKYIKTIYYDNDFYINPDNPCIHPNGYVYSQLMSSYRELNN